MAKKTDKNENTEKKMFTVKYVGDRKERIQKLMKKYNKLTIAGLIDELLLIGELNNDSIYSFSAEDREDPLIALSKAKNEFNEKQLEDIRNDIKTLQSDMKEIKEFLLTKTTQEKDKLIIEKRKKEEIFDEEKEDF